ncbi:Rieske 2Fe-2S domain-containing protein [Mycobacterium riyadhense]|uniref:(2Fe-2S)-binding protein n=1 Tax=Mycobacterium riyadhense TaxID=486698 RepID=A0A1X2DGR8_9MYCO|nr:Rieske 2Fe-2S domain-containing protein [Mycobacterium riyadhense]MCV7147854.1 Rieske 2Fe-2S domain-containing protein [Mycobacterium riyadhense]ORW87318.1 (2Fe-2S)-binding protein [Mycobacterium riyadhense]
MVDRSPDRQPQNFGSRVLRAIGRQQWLDRPSYRLEHVLSFGFNALGGARDRVTNALNGVWLGHPVHPPLASFASGALGTTVALDALSMLPGQNSGEAPGASRIASRALRVGIMASVGAAMTGVTDWQHTHQEDRRVGLVHGAVNSVATALYALSWWDRRRGHRLRGMALSALGYGITVGGSYLGGALVFESGIGIDQSGERLRTTEWTPVLPATSLQDGKPQRVEVDGVGLVVCQTNPGEVAAFGEFCPHLAAPMADGWVDRGRIVCPWHGSRFALETGEVLRGPSATPLPCYQARLVDGTIEVAGSGVIK